MPAETHVEQGPLGRDEIFEIVRDRLADILEIEPSTISEGQSFVDDLDADSLALIELVEALEEELSERTVGFRIDDEDLADLKTVRDAVDYVHDTDPGGRLTLDALAARIGYEFADPELLARAMAHRSWCAEHPGTLSNERLEFLGDAVLGWVVADLAFRRFADLPEGALTGVRKGVVNALALADVAEDLDLGAFLLLGRGEDAAGGREKPSILSDALEAVLGAVYVDGGPAVAYDVDRAADRPAPRRDRRPPRPPRPQVAAAGAGRRRRRSAPPEYVTRAEGPDHAKRFFATVVVDGAVARRGHRPLEEGGRAGGRRGRRAPTLDAADVAGDLTPCLSCPRSRPSGAGSPTHVVGRTDRARRGRARAHGAADVGAGRSIDGLTGATILDAGRRGKYLLLPARHRRHADGAPADERPAAARPGRARRARRTPTSC